MRSARGRRYRVAWRSAPGGAARPPGSPTDRSAAGGRRRATTARPVRPSPHVVCLAGRIRRARVRAGTAPRRAVQAGAPVRRRGWMRRTGAWNYAASGRTAAGRERAAPVVEVPSVTAPAPPADRRCRRRCWRCGGPGWRSSRTRPPCRGQWTSNIASPVHLCGLWTIHRRMWYPVPGPVRPKLDCEWSQRDDRRPTVGRRKSRSSSGRGRPAGARCTPSSPRGCGTRSNAGCCCPAPGCRPSVSSPATSSSAGAPSSPRTTRCVPTDCSRAGRGAARASRNSFRHRDRSACSSPLNPVYRSLLDNGDDDVISLACAITGAHPAVGEAIARGRGRRAAHAAAERGLPPARTSRPPRPHRRLPHARRAPDRAGTGDRDDGRATGRQPLRRALCPTRRPRGRRVAELHAARSTCSGRRISIRSRRDR